MHELVEWEMMSPGAMGGGGLGGGGLGGGGLTGGPAVMPVSSINFDNFSIDATGSTVGTATGGAAGNATDSAIVSAIFDLVHVSQGVDSQAVAITLDGDTIPLFELPTDFNTPEWQGPGGWGSSAGAGDAYSDGLSAIFEQLSTNAFIAADAYALAHPDVVQQIADHLGISSSDAMGALTSAITQGKTGFSYGSTTKDSNGLEIVTVTNVLFHTTPVAYVTDYVIDTSSTAGASQSVSTQAFHPTDTQTKAQREAALANLMAEHHAHYEKTDVLIDSDHNLIETAEGHPITVDYYSLPDGTVLTITDVFAAREQASGGTGGAIEYFDNRQDLTNFLETKPVGSWYEDNGASSTDMTTSLYAGAADPGWTGPMSTTFTVNGHTYTETYDAAQNLDVTYWHEYAHTHLGIPAGVAGGNDENMANLFGFYMIGNDVGDVPATWSAIKAANS